MVTLGLITMTIQAEERAKHPKQETHGWWTEMPHTTPSEKPMPRWLAAIGHVVARLGRKAQRQPSVTACCVEGHFCAHV